MMDLGLIVDVVWKVGTLLGFAWMYQANRDKVTNARIGKLEDDLDETLGNHGNRLTHLESTQEMQPTHGDLARLHQRIDEMAGAIKRLEGESSSQTRILNLVYESLISRSK